MSEKKPTLEYAAPAPTEPRGIGRPAVGHSLRLVALAIFALAGSVLGAATRFGDDGICITIGAGALFLIDYGASWSKWGQE